MDLGIVLVMGPLVSPLMLAIALYIRLVSSGPVLFKQSRVGYGGDRFLIYKFRTLRVADTCRDAGHRELLASYSGCDGAMKKPDYQKELIPGGGILRKLSIDELPQLLNIWQGTMSLVGPRPDVLHLEDYEKDHLRRFEVLPGITGLWQVSGKNRLSFQRMVELDIEYVDSRSLKHDLLILAKTACFLFVTPNE